MKHLFIFIFSVCCMSATGQNKQNWSAIELPVKSVTLKKGIKLQYVEQGSKGGIPVILLHGFTDSWKSYDKMLTLLPAKFHTFALTQRGHGDADKPSKNYAPSDFGSDVIAFMDQMQLDQAYIIGHSMGATITQQLMLKSPQRIRGVVLLGSFAAFKDHPVVQPFSEEIKLLNDTLERSYAYGFQASTVNKPLDSLYLQQFVDESMKVPARVWKAVFAELMQTDYTEQLRKIDKPALLIWGAKDNFCTKEDHKRLIEALRGAKVIVYEDLGHAIHWEDPEKVTKDIVRFIEQQEPGKKNHAIIQQQ